MDPQVKAMVDAWQMSLEAQGGRLKDKAPLEKARALMAKVNALARDHGATMADFSARMQQTNLNNEYAVVLAEINTAVNEGR
jgi:hypothetical protein